MSEPTNPTPPLNPTLTIPANPETPMNSNTTDNATTPSSIETVAQHLSPNQRDALTALITGQTVKAAAKAAGVHRSTLHRWMTRDAHFRAAYNAYQHEAKESAKVKLLASVLDAVNVVIEGIKEGDRKIAYNLLKDLGLLAKLQPGLTDPDLLLTQIQLEHAKRLSSLDAEVKQLGTALRPPN